MLRILLLIVLIPPFLGGPVTNGRRGNEHYRVGQWDEAERAYRQGLGKAGPGHAFALQNNLGLALYRKGNFDEALTALEASLAESIEKSQFARASFNAGNAAVHANKLEEALDFYHRALRADPSDVDARYNYEYVKRRLNQKNASRGQGAGEGAPQGDPSDGNDSPTPQQSDSPQNEPGDQQNDPENPQPEDSEPPSIDRDQVERILEAMQNDEEQLLRNQRRMNERPIEVEKDW